MNSTLPPELALQASDPLTNPQTLANLAKTHPTLGGLIAANPNTPMPVLLELWMTHPLALIENPVLAFQALSSGKTFAELIPLRVKFALYGAIRQADRLEDLEIYLPDEVRCKWIDLINRQDLALIEAWLASDSIPAIRLYIAKTIPLALLQAQANDPSIEVRLVLASRARNCLLPTTEPIIDQLAADPDPTVRTTLAEGTALTSTAHELLSRDPLFLIKKILAQTAQSKNNLAESGWRNLYQTEVSLRNALSKNPSCHPAVLFDLALHEDLKIRVQAWERINLHYPPLQESIHQQVENVLVGAQFKKIRWAIAKNPTVRSPIVERLITTGQGVAMALTRNIHLQRYGRASLLNHPRKKVVLSAAKYLSGTSWKLVHLAIRHPNPIVRAFIADQEGREPAKLRPLLAQDIDESVRMTVAKFILRRRWETGVYGGAHPLEEQSLQILAEDSSQAIRLYLANHEATPSSVIETLANSSSIDVLLAIAHQLGTKESLARLSLHPSEKVRLAAVANRRVTSEILSRLVNDSSPKVRRAVASNSSTSIDSLISLTSDSVLKVRLAVGANYYITALVLNHLVKDSSEKVRLAVASHSSTAEGSLLTLASDTALAVRLAVIANHHTTALILNHLAKDSSEKVRLAVASHSSTAEGSLLTLASDTALAVRLAVIANHHTTALILNHLAKDSSEKVRLAVASHRSTAKGSLLTLASDAALAVRLAVIANHHTTAAIFDHLANDPSTELRVRLAEHKAERLGHSHLTILTIDPQESVRLAVANNQHTSEDSLLILASDSSIAVRLAVIENGSITTAIRLHLTQDPALEVRRQLATYDRYYTDPQIAHLINLAEDPEASVRLAVAKHQHTSEKILLLLASDSSVPVRLAVIAHKNTTKAIRIHLTKDPDIAVRLRLAEFGRDYDRYTRSQTEHASYLINLSADPEESVRLAILANDWIPPDVITQLITDPSETVRLALIQTKKFRDEDFLILLNETQPTVQAALIHLDIPNTAGACFPFALKEPGFNPNTSCTTDFLDALQISTNPYHRAMVAACERAGVKRLRSLINDPHWFVLGKLHKHAPTIFTETPSSDPSDPSNTPPPP